MQTLKRNKELIFPLIDAVKQCDSKYFDHSIIENAAITKNTISIFMTSSNRSKQTCYTLDTFASSTFKDVHVVIVDDSDVDPITVGMLLKYNFYIDLIKIKRENKCWHNPCVNYNVAFQFIKGSKAIIQNSEVCHVGDVLQYVADNINEMNYYVFDVIASNGFDSNAKIMELGTTSLDILNHKSLFKQDWWYQSESRNEKFHFLTAMPREVFDKIDGFSYDYSYGSWYDDNDFLIRIRAKDIPIISVFHNHINVMGIHLFHTSASGSWDRGKEYNEFLWKCKRNYLDEHGSYIEIAECMEQFDENFEKLMSCAPK